MTLPRDHTVWSNKEAACQPNADVGELQSSISDATSTRRLDLSHVHKHTSYLITTKLCQTAYTLPCPLSFLLAPVTITTPSTLCSYPLASKQLADPTPN